VVKFKAAGSRFQIAGDNEPPMPVCQQLTRSNSLKFVEGKQPKIGGQFEEST
jgi:hypothetical protein